jgi:23S rRNA (guanine2445-N2)-methyltransferase / 23S rRNA (guanine2069-N7)-methyltransferase
VVTFEGSLETAYRACLWLRSASRVLLPLGTFDAPDASALYDGARAIAWRDHVGSDATLAVDCDSVTEGLPNSHFSALRVKDAVVDRLRDETGARPSIDTGRPDVRLRLHVEREGQATVSLDLAGEPLHRRGWRTAAGAAPMKETLAAAILLMADWPRRAAAGEPLLDPFCGAGTFPIEAALIALNRAPGLSRARFGFEGWAGHDASLWQHLRDDARGVVRSDQAGLAEMIGSDVDARMVSVARANVVAAGLDDEIRIERRGLDEVAPRAGQVGGLVVANPPYGERLGDEAGLRDLYRSLGDVLRRRFLGWTGFVLCGQPALAREIGLKSARRTVLFNGPIECRLLELPIASLAPASGDQGPAWRRPRPRAPLSAGAQALQNRLGKNRDKLEKWAAREKVSCYRLYDADLPEYAAAIDLYEGSRAGGGPHARALHLQEYEPPGTIDAGIAARRLEEMIAVAAEVTGLPEDEVYLKTRRRQRGGTQYERAGGEAALFEIEEGGHRFLVNLSEYLDTGLFLDQRRLRSMLGEEARGRDFLDLYCYTATSTVYAARGGAHRTVSVDLSRTYLDWAEKNLALNRVRGAGHDLVRNDCLRYLRATTTRFGLILLAPPSFSRSKKMVGTLDVQRDHVELIRAASRLLAPGGSLFFTTHLRRFRMDGAGLAELHVEDISKHTVPLDFMRDTRAHHAFRIERRAQRGE